ncbi:M48 family metallopeptidase [Aliidiomarina celeris]|uniref:M48 family metallopeptidase n=1 Tax=Aliidiomarina celeris TaxID=2249428 RepID=UPI000DE854B0|nr:M48 family metallopeptidase [Aliidiomarina celeris]
MNFFEHQDIARRNTRLLIVLFGLAVVTLVGLTGLVVAGFMGGIGASTSSPYNSQATTDFVWHWDIIVAACGVVLSSISLAVLYKWAVLRPGGRVVAESLGGRLLSADSNEPLERKVLNVVEEMAIAANMPVPPVYLLDQEPSINAFAAGYSPKDAVIGLTRGCAEQLTRDQLQGVVAHEIAHILNGDMRMNIRIMAILNGILFISHAGYLLLRSGMVSAGRRNDKNPLPLLGIALLIIGSIGVLFGNIIKAAVSRQREYLADASAVQFTRNPEGIGGALQQIGAVQSGSEIQSKNADEAAHLFFGQAINRWVSIFATHPPLAKRIKRVLPQWNGTFQSNTAEQLTLTKNESTSPQTQSIGLSGHNEQLARLALLASLPETLCNEARGHNTAEGLLLALMLSEAPKVQAEQLQLITERHDAELSQQAEQHFSKVQGLTTEQRLPLVEVAMPAVKALTASEKQLLLGTLQQLKQVDQSVSLYEWCLAQLVERYLRADLKPNYKVPHVRLKAQTDTELTLSILAWYGHEQNEHAHAAFNAGAKYFKSSLRPITTRPFSFGDLADALDRIDHWQARAKENLVKAWVACVKHDGSINAVERKLLFTLAACISEPLPNIPEN